MRRCVYVHTYPYTVSKLHSSICCSNIGWLLSILNTSNINSVTLCEQTMFLSVVHWRRNCRLYNFVRQDHPTFLILKQKRFLILWYLDVYLLEMACINRRNDYSKESCFNVKIWLKADSKYCEPVLYMLWNFCLWFCWNGLWPNSTKIMAWLTSLCLIQHLNLQQNISNSVLVQITT